MSEYICKTNNELPSYLFDDVQIQARLSVYAGQIFAANSLVNKSGNYKVYVPSTVTNVEEQDLCIILNGGFDELPDGRRADGNPDYGQYRFRTGDVATAVRLDQPNISLEISLDSLVEGINPVVGGYLIPTNGSNKLSFVAENTTITAKNFLKVEGVKYFKLGGQFGESYAPTLICRVISSHAKPLYGVSISTTPVWADIELFTKDGLKVNEISHGVYEVFAGDYVYNAKANGYNPIVATKLEVVDDDVSIEVNMTVSDEDAIVIFNKTPVESELILYLDGDEVITNPDLSYSLGEGDYTYDVTADGYEASLNNDLVIATTDLGKTKTIDVELTEITLTGGSQTGTLTHGEVGNATFSLTSTGLGDGTPIQVYECDEDGRKFETPSVGISAQASNISSNSSTLTVTTTDQVVAGTYYFNSSVSANNVIVNYIATVTVE